jgi:diguanylate cyclase (GGDEF)-like protein
MSVGLTQRFGVSPRWWSKTAITLGAILGAAVALAALRSVRLETFAVQAGCAALLSHSLWLTRKGPKTAADFILSGTFGVIGALLAVQCAFYLMAPDVAPLVGAWHASLWGVVFQYTGVFTSIALGFSILLTVSMDLIETQRRNSHTDALTEVLNRRGFEEHSARLAKSTQSPPRAALIMVDIDRFKLINDTFGHRTGDLVIARMAALLKRLVGRRGCVGRIGGEEFALFLPDTTLEAANAFANEARQAFSEMGWPEMTETTRLTASFGVTSLAVGETIADAADRADALLYLAKRAGRDRVMSGDALSDKGVPVRQGPVIFSSIAKDRKGDVIS